MINNESDDHQNKDFIHNSVAYHTNHSSKRIILTQTPSQRIKQCHIFETVKRTRARERFGKALFILMHEHDATLYTQILRHESIVK